MQIVIDDKKIIDLLETEWGYEGIREYVRRLLIENGTPQNVLDKIRSEIKDWQTDIHDNEYDAEKHDFVFERIFEIIDEYRESEDKE